jgi:hypothetical protein
MLNMGRNFIGGLTEGINYPRGRSSQFMDLQDCNDIIIVDRKYFIENKGFINWWALEGDEDGKKRIQEKIENQMMSKGIDFEI